MASPITEITELDSSATQQEIIDKINEIVALVNKDILGIVS
jgi:hypothetical protein